MNRLLMASDLTASDRLDLVVKDVRDETARIRSFTLVSAGGALLPDFAPGAHIELTLPNGMRRCYSLCGDPGDRSAYRIAVLRDDQGRGGSRFMHDRIGRGDRATASAPHNNFPLNENAGESVLIAGGIGITPLLPMAMRLQSLGRKWSLHYAVRSRADMALAAELSELGGDIVIHDDAGGDRLILSDVVAGTDPAAHFYCCGPAGMLEDFRAVLASHPVDRVHYERFAAVFEPSGGFTVDLARSGGSIVVSPGETILDALIDAGLDLPYSCQQGICGTCRTRVLSGCPDHRDEILSPREKDRGDVMMICCSGAKSEKLVLDL